MPKDRCEPALPPAMIIAVPTTGQSAVGPGNVVVPDRRTADARTMTMPAPATTVPIATPRRRSSGRCSASIAPAQNSQARRCGR